MEALEPRIALDASLLRITEFVASNDDSLDDYDGDSSDWLEIYNPGVDTVDLGGLHLTDNANNLVKWTFPAGTVLPGGGYRIVFASNKNTVKPNGEVHTNFALSAGGEYLALVAADGTTIIDQFAPQFPPQFEDISYGRAMALDGATTTVVASGAQAKVWIPTSNMFDATWKGVDFNDAAFTIVGPTGVGYENNPGDSVNFGNEIGTTVPSGTASAYIRIPFELTTLAGIGRLQLRMKYDDGFVAYVNGVKVAEAFAPETVQWNSQASGGRADSEAKIFRDFDVSFAIPQLRIGQNVLAIHGLNFPAGSDMLILPELVAQSASIVVPEDLGYFYQATPGYANAGTNVAGFAEQVAFSVPHGLYDSTQIVSLSTPTPEAIIVYTTDGSTPAASANLTVTNGQLYTQPIIVSGTTTLRATAFKLDYTTSFVSASTYLFLDDVITQSPNGETPAGWAPDGLNGQRMDYGIDPNIISLYGAQAVKDSLASIPSLSITTDLANLFHPATGIYVNATYRGRDWERAASVELINPDGSDGFMVNAGLRIRGGYSRNDFNPKHAFRLYFRGEYGDSRLRYPLFGDEGVDVFDVIDLRTAQNYSWSSEGNLQNTFTREEFSRDLQRDLDQPYTRSRYYHLYLDGVYWGLFETQERVEKFYGESYFGGDESDYDVVKHGLGDVGGTELADGNDLAWRQLFDYGELVAANPTANADVYWTMQGLNPDGTRNPNLPVLLDVENLIDFMMVIIYTGGYDSGISQFLGNNKANNWFGIYNRTTADRGFQFFVHDNEHSLGAAGTLHGSASIDRTGPFNFGNESEYAQFNPQYLHQDLLGHLEYRQKFIDKTQEYFFNGGPLTVANNIARMMERVVQVDPAIIAEAARWGDAQVEPPRNKTTWQNEINWLLNTYFPARGTIVLNQLRGDGLFTTFAAPVFNQHGGDVPANFALTMSGIGGTIYYTLDGVTDPRTIGGGVNPSSAVQVYTGAVALGSNTTVKARLRTSGGLWSGLVEASFQVPATPGDYNGDQTVDGSDFLAWQRQFGSPAVPAGHGADGNQNGVVDAGDLGLWQEHFGAAPTTVAAAVLPADDLVALAAWSVAENPAEADANEAPLIDEALAVGRFPSRTFDPDDDGNWLRRRAEGDQAPWRSSRRANDRFVAEWSAADDAFAHWIRGDRHLP
ncbi:MAG: chitobiase/beta-hexosaminidase C-terminal domain-containing protein [Pirellulales bacterium]|nr:chitobiase/beta-hexosaminidase C-terminal domain-containing protein [Pirellulales bacterium]